MRRWEDMGTLQRKGNNVFRSATTGLIARYITLFIIVIMLPHVNIAPEAISPLPPSDATRTNNKNVKENASVVAVGDSTMALSNGRKMDSAGGCRHEKDNWVSLVDKGSMNISCSGATVKDTHVRVRDTIALGDKTKTVLITVGSNSFRKKETFSSLVQQIEDMTATIEEKAPGADIVFVGYLPVIAEPKCMTDRYVSTVRYINLVHKAADMVMQQVASEKGYRFVDFSSATYNICNQNSTLVRIPHTTPGAAWHTTPQGHRYITQKILDANVMGVIDDGSSTL